MPDYKYRTTAIPLGITTAWAKLTLGDVAVAATTPFMQMCAVTLVGNVVAAQLIHEAQSRSLSARDLAVDAPAEALQTMLASSGMVISAAAHGGRALSTTVTVVLLTGPVVMAARMGWSSFRCAVLGEPKASRRRATWRGAGGYLSQVMVIAAFMVATAQGLQALSTGSSVSVVWSIVMIAALLGVVGVRWWDRAAHGRVSVLFDAPRLCWGPLPQDGIGALFGLSTGTDTGAQQPSAARVEGGQQ